MESARMVVCAKAVRELDRQIRPTISSCDGEGTIVPKFQISHCRENPLVRYPVPVPETDTGRRGENPKVSGRTLVKELGKMTDRKSTRLNSSNVAISYAVFFL